MKKQAESVFNGMIQVPNISIEYRGYTIRPKLDMGGTPWLCNGNSIRRGYIVTKDHAQIMPGGAWFGSVIEAKAGIDILIAADGNGSRFWELFYEANGNTEYSEV